MVDQTPRYRRVAPYKFEQSVRTEDPIAVFLSDYDDQPDPSEYVTPPRKDGRRFVSARILAGVLATAAAAILFAIVFFGCHTRHHRQREGFNCGFPSGALRSAAA